MEASTHVRWMIRRDMTEVLEIERQSFGQLGWTEEGFIGVLKARNCIGMIAEHKERIVGYMIYEFMKSHFHLRNFAVDPATRRMGVGALMIEKLIKKLTQQRRQEIRLEVREGNLAAQLFFKSLGFAATNVVRGFYEDTTEDAYVMRYRLGGQEPRGVNRIAALLGDE